MPAPKVNSVANSGPLASASAKPPSLGAASAAGLRLTALARAARASSTRLKFLFRVLERGTAGGELTTEILARIALGEQLGILAGAPRSDLGALLDFQRGEKLAGARQLGAERHAQGDAPHGGARNELFQKGARGCHVALPVSQLPQHITPVALPASGTFELLPSGRERACGAFAAL